jgi:hypothetical protein
MRPKKLQDPCIICKTVADIKYYSVTELGLNKANADKTNILNLSLGNILCHNYYMKTVEWDRYEKQKPRIKKQSKYDDFTYQMKINHITMSQKKYESLSEKAKGVEELQEHINQLELMLEQALSWYYNYIVNLFHLYYILFIVIILLENPPFADFFIDKMRRLTSVLYILQHQEK